MARASRPVSSPNPKLMRDAKLLFRKERELLPGRKNKSPTRRATLKFRSFAARKVLPDLRIELRSKAKKSSKRLLERPARSPSRSAPTATTVKFKKKEMNLLMFSP